jgi:hypothetical protein
VDELVFTNFVGMNIIPLAIGMALFVLIVAIILGFASA